MFDQLTDRHVGSITHLTIAKAIELDLDPNHAAAFTATLWKDLGRGLPWQARTRVTNLTALYLRMLRPHGWDLIGTEMHLGSSVADLVWAQHDHAGARQQVFIDEIKTGRNPLEHQQTINQIVRLHRDGQQRWGTIFAGVRVAELRRINNSRFWKPKDPTVQATNSPLAGNTIR